MWHITYTSLRVFIVSNIVSNILPNQHHLGEDLIWTCEASVAQLTTDESSSTCFSRPIHFCLLSLTKNPICGGSSVEKINQGVAILYYDPMLTYLSIFSFSSRFCSPFQHFIIYLITINWRTVMVNYLSVWGKPLWHDGNDPSKYKVLYFLRVKSIPTNSSMSSEEMLQPE